MKEVKKMINAKLECHLIGPHALSHEVSVYIYIYIWSVWIELIFAETKNWKHCSKIIFKCVNNIVGLMNSAWTVHEQCFFPCTVKLNKRGKNLMKEVKKYYMQN